MKRRLLKLGVFLLCLLIGGAALNASVAWGLSMRRSHPEPEGFGLADDASKTWWRRNAPLGFPDTPTGMCVTHQSAGELRIMLYDTELLGPKTRFHGHRIAFGWPMISMERSGWSDVVRRMGESRNAFRWSSWPYTPLNSQNFPLRPVWPGFAINTMFYAAILGLTFLGYGKARRLVRVRHHRCPACGHIIAAGTCANGLCSECGSPLPKGFKPKPDASAHT